jgi:hypothetical protein
MMARKLVGTVLLRVESNFLNMGDPWTEEALLPGGEIVDFAYFTDE